MGLKRIGAYGGLSFVFLTSLSASLASDATLADATERQIVRRPALIKNHVDVNQAQVAGMTAHTGRPITTTSSCESSWWTPRPMSRSRTVTASTRSLLPAGMGTGDGRLLLGAGAIELRVKATRRH